MERSEGVEGRAVLVLYLAPSTKGLIMFFGSNLLKGRPRGIAHKLFFKVELAEPRSRLLAIPPSVNRLVSGGLVMCRYPCIKSGQGC